MIGGANPQLLQFVVQGPRGEAEQHGRLLLLTGRPVQRLNDGVILQGHQVQGAADGRQGSGRRRCAAPWRSPRVDDGHVVGVQLKGGHEGDTGRLRLFATGTNIEPVAGIGLEDVGHQP